MTLNILGQQGHSGRQGAIRIYYELLKKDIILWAVALNKQLILRMTATESMYSLPNLKHVGIFDYMEDTIRIQTIYTTMVYFLKVI